MRVSTGDVDLSPYLIKCNVSISGGETNSRASLTLAIDALDFIKISTWIDITGDSYQFSFRIKAYDVRLNGQITVTGAGLRSEPLLPPGYSRVSLATLAKALDSQVVIPQIARTAYAGIDAGLQSTAAILYFLAKSTGLVVTDTGKRLYLRERGNTVYTKLVEYTEDVTPEGNRISMTVPLNPQILPGDIVNSHVVSEIDHELTGTTSTITSNA